MNSFFRKFFSLFFVIFFSIFFVNFVKAEDDFVGPPEPDGGVCLCQKMNPEFERKYVGVQFPVNEIEVDGFSVNIINITDQLRKEIIISQPVPSTISPRDLCLLVDKDKLIKFNTHFFTDCHWEFDVKPEVGCFCQKKEGGVFGPLGPKQKMVGFDIGMCKTNFQQEEGAETAFYQCEWVGSTVSESEAAREGVESGEGPGLISKTERFKLGEIKAKAEDALNPLRLSSLRSVIASIIRVIMSIIGSITLVMFMYGGVLWMFANGNEDQTSKARKVIIWSALGLIVILASYAIVKVVFEAISG